MDLPPLHVGRRRELNEELCQFVEQSKLNVGGDKETRGPSQFCERLKFESLQHELRRKQDAYDVTDEEMRDANAKMDFGSHLVQVVSAVSIGPVDKS